MKPIFVLAVILFQGGLKTELSPAVSFHCSNTILRVWHMSDKDYDPMSDDDLEALRVDLVENCSPKQGWGIEDGFYHDAALGGVLSRLLVRSREDDTKNIQELIRVMDENKRLKTELKKREACAK